MRQDSIRPLKSKANVVEGQDSMLSWAGKEAYGRSSSDRKGMSFSTFEPVESMRYQSISQSSAIDMQKRYALCLLSMTTSALRILKGTCVLSSPQNSGGQLKATLRNMKKSWKGCENGDTDRTRVHYIYMEEERNKKEKQKGKEKDKGDQGITVTPMSQ